MRNICWDGLNRVFAKNIITRQTPRAPAFDMTGTLIEECNKIWNPKGCIVDKAEHLVRNSLQMSRTARPLSLMSLQSSQNTPVRHAS